MKRFFITGTDTDCGKTWATCALLAHYNRHTLRAVGIKPVASGCLVQDKLLISEDALHLQQSTGLDLDNINPWRYADPVSPHIAAKYTNTPLSIEKIADYCLQFTHASATHLFIEGAGGLMVPLNDKELWTDFLKLTGIPVILVVGIRTGCINHALLTQIALQQQSIPFAGWIANCLYQDMPALAENIQTLQEFLQAPLLGKIAYKGDLKPCTTGDLL